MRVVLRVSEYPLTVFGGGGEVWGLFSSAKKDAGLTVNKRTSTSASNGIQDLRRIFYSTDKPQ